MQSHSHHPTSCSVLSSSQRLLGSLPPGATASKFPPPSWLQFQLSSSCLCILSSKSSLPPPSPSDSGHRYEISETEETTQCIPGWHLLKIKRQYAYFNRSPLGSQNRQSDGKDTQRGLLSCFQLQKNMFKAALVLYSNSITTLPPLPATSSEKVFAHLRLDNRQSGGKSTASSCTLHL